MLAHLPHAIIIIFEFIFACGALAAMSESKQIIIYLIVLINPYLNWHFSFEIELNRKTKIVCFFLIFQFVGDLNDPVQVWRTGQIVLDHLSTVDIRIVVNRRAQNGYRGSPAGQVINIHRKGHLFRLPSRERAVLTVRMWCPNKQKQNLCKNEIAHMVNSGSDRVLGPNTKHRQVCPIASHTFCVHCVCET